MTPFQGLLFFYVLGLLLIPAIVLGLLGRPIRRYGMLFTAVMLLFLFSENGQLPALAAFTLWQMALCLLFWRCQRKTRRILRLVILLSLLPLAAVKVGEVLPALSFPQMLGISYMTFRAVQVLLDIYDGKLRDLHPLDLCYFLLFFPSVASGPIDRYRRFLGDIHRTPSREEYLSLLRRGIWKLMFGALASMVIGGLLQAAWLEPLPKAGLLPAVSYMYGYTLYLFCNFAGYSSMAIGTSYLLGISLPENFNMPFLSVDLKEFWSRWHISLSGWLRDYLYTRFVMDSLKKKRFRRQRTASYLGYLITMTTMGAWHGLTPAYLLYGAYHGLLMCLNEALDLHWKPFRKIKRQGWPQVVSVVVTFHLFSFGLLIFSGRLFS